MRWMCARDPALRSRVPARTRRTHARGRILGRASAEYGLHARLCASATRLRRRRDTLRAGGESEAERTSLGVPTDRPPRPGMNHASPERRDLLERGLHVRDGEVRQRGPVAGAGATFVNAKHGSATLGLPAATLGLAARGELDAQHARPELTRTVGIIRRELDQAKRCVHAADDNRAARYPAHPRRAAGPRPSFESATCRVVLDVGAIVSCTQAARSSPFRRAPPALRTTRLEPAQRSAESLCRELAARSARIERRLMCRWSANAPWLLGIDVGRV